MALRFLHAAALSCLWVLGLPSGEGKQHAKRSVDLNHGRDGGIVQPHPADTHTQERLADRGCVRGGHSVCVRRCVQASQLF
jgi:hypothetical protein